MGVAQYLFTLVLLLPKISAPDVHNYPSILGSPLSLCYTGSNNDDIKESFEKRGRRGSLVWFDLANMWRGYHAMGFQAAASKLGLRCATSVKELKGLMAQGRFSLGGCFSPLMLSHFCSHSRSHAEVVVSFRGLFQELLPSIRRYMSPPGRYCPVAGGCGYGPPLESLLEGVLVLAFDFELLDEELASRTRKKTESTRDVSKTHGSPELMIDEKREEKVER